MSGLRIAAWRILRETSGDAVDRALDQAGLEPRDRALARRLLATEMRRRATLRALVAAFATGKPNVDVSAHLRLGLVQLLFLDQVPPHAAVSETVGAAHRTLGPGRSRYVNAVLREAQRALREGRSGDPRRDLEGRALHFARDVFRDPSTQPFLWAEDALSMPAPIVKRWSRRHGHERALELARQALEEPWLSVRSVPADAAARERLAHELAALEPRAAHHRAVLLVAPAHAEELLGSAAFREGRATIQGESALAAAELVGACAGERVLELCAAPGGKTAVLAESGASVLATDVAPERLPRLHETLARLRPAGAVEVAVSDGAQALDARDFDAVLVDAPCSNTGVLAKRPGARWRFGPATRASLRALQQRLLEEGAGRVRPGGRLVWSTCSLEPEENGQLVRAFLAGRAGWELAEEHEALPARDPAEGPVDGGYRARLVRRG